jgi:hypothetical protein
MKERLKLIKEIIKEELNKDVFVLNQPMWSVFNGDIYKIIHFLNKKNYGRIELPLSLSLFSQTLTKLPDNLNINGGLTLVAKNLKELPKNLTVRGNIDARETSIVDLPEDTTIIRGDFYPSSNEKRRNNNEWDINLVAKDSVGERANALYKYIIETFDNSEFVNINNFDVYDIIPTPIKHGKMFQFEIPKLEESEWAVGTYDETEHTAHEYKKEELEVHVNNLDIDSIKPYLNKRQMLRDALEYISDAVYENPEGWGVDPDDINEDGEYNEDVISERINFYSELAREDIFKFYMDNGMEDKIHNYLILDDYVADIIEEDGFDFLDQYYDSIGEQRINLNDYYIARID